jgi:hypothetical protein
MKLKLFMSLAALVLLSLSGCCRYLGICASASVSTSIESPQHFAQQDGTENTLGIFEGHQIASVPFQPRSCTD